MSEYNVLRCKFSALHKQCDCLNTCFIYIYECNDKLNAVVENLLKNNFRISFRWELLGTYVA